MVSLLSTSRVMVFPVSVFTKICILPVLYVPAAPVFAAAATPPGTGAAAAAGAGFLYLVAPDF